MYRLDKINFRILFQFLLAYRCYPTHSLLYFSFPLIRMDDAFEVGALRAVPVNEMNISRVMIERTIVPLIRDERTLRTLIGNKRSYEHRKTTTPTIAISIAERPKTTKRRFVQPFVTGEDRETTTATTTSATFLEKPQSFDLSDSINRLSCVA